MEVEFSLCYSFPQTDDKNDFNRRGEIVMIHGKGLKVMSYNKECVIWKEVG